MRDAVVEWLPFISDPFIAGVVFGSLVTLSVCILYYDYAIKQVSEPLPVLYEMPWADSDAGGDDDARE